MTQKTKLGIPELLSSHQKAQILAIAEKHGAENVRVFGSIARGEATPNSDLDLLVDYNRAKRSAWFPIGLKLDLEQLLHRPVDIATVSMLKERMRDRVLAEAVKL
ncbi:MAG: nucleotidyltransferase family protein [Spirulinaceae cyanobacterium]